ncbi:HNH endonuclease signature motif containing protein [Brevibacterium jeotgali]|nr:HNH endonuclease signature motif containing protein [Brevibacterium jeotgali]
MVDRLRAHELVHIATTALTLALTRRSSEVRLADLLADEEPDRAGPDSAVDATPLSLEDPERFLTRAEYLLEREHEAVLNVRLNARTGDSRRRVGLALTAYIGMPLLLRSMLSGQIRFNRWEALTRRFKHLPLTHLHALDVFLAGLDPRYSLGQFLRHAASFLAQFESRPVLAARARTERSVWVEHLPDGLALHCMKGPAPVIEAHHTATRAAATAIWKNQLTNMTVTRTDRSTYNESGSTPSFGSRSSDGEESSDDKSVPDDKVASDVEGLPDLSSLSRSDDRSIRQLMFDLLIGATPRTQSVLERVTVGGETTDRYHVDIVCPDEATVLRKQATVVVTVPMTTLLGLDDRPGTIAGEPLPADMARTIAASSTFWYRMLTDPATGQVLDEVALKYKPDKATRLSVLGTWQTCTVPGCSRPAQECEIDHGIPFDHEHPEIGGRTEPANLHPLCTSHHQAKTEGRIRMRRTQNGEVEWFLPLGTTATTVAPSVDDGGVLTAACAPEDTPARREARRTVERRTIRDPQTNRRVADAAFDQAGRDFVAAEHAAEKRRATRTSERATLVQEQIRIRRWAEVTRQGLQDRTDRLREQEATARTRERRAARDEQLAALAHADAEAKLDEATRLTAAAAQRQKSPSRSSGQVPGQAVAHGAARPQSASERIRYRTLIPMRIEHFELEHGLTGSLHTPVFFGVRPVNVEDTRSDDRAHSEKSRSAPKRSSTGPRLSIAEDGLATVLHDAFAHRRVVIVDEGIGPRSTPKPGSDSATKSKLESEPEPGSGTEDDVDDDPPPF